MPHRDKLKYTTQQKMEIIVLCQCFNFFYVYILNKEFVPDIKD